MLTRSAMACRGTQTHPPLLEASFDAYELPMHSPLIGGTTPKVWDALPAAAPMCEIQLAAPTGMELPRSWSSGSSASSFQPAILIAIRLTCFHTNFYIQLIQPTTSKHKTPWALEQAVQEQPPCVLFSSAASVFPYRFDDVACTKGFCIT